MPPLSTSLRSFTEKHRLLFQVGATPEGAAEFYCFSHDESKTRRYLYAQVWDQAASTALWVMFNPGTGETEKRRRPTLERCIEWSRKRGHGSLLICNLTSLRTKTAKLVPTQEPLSETVNLFACELGRSLASESFVAWGSAANRREIPRELLATLDGALCLGTTNHGHPRHPLYVRSATTPHLWHRGSEA